VCGVELPGVNRTKKWCEAFFARVSTAELRFQYPGITFDVVDGVGEAEELAMSAAGHAFADGGAVEHARAANRVVVPLRS
jgi:hypothetical protein